MTTFFLVRHGDTNAVGVSLAGSKPGCHLNSKGRDQARRLAELLSPLAIQAIYTSPLERALETAEAIGEPHAMVPSVRENLGEFRFGDWEGRSFEELNQDSRWHQFNAARSTVRAPGGELMGEVQTRMSREVESLRRKHDGETVLLVSHADPLRSLVAHYLGIPLDLILRFDISPASISIVRFFGESLSLLCLNRTQEIPL